VQEHIARQEELIQRMRVRGQRTEWSEQMLNVVKGALGAFEEHRELIASKIDAEQQR
jgi:hypothetical protein